MESELAWLREALDPEEIDANGLHVVGIGPQRARAGLAKILDSQHAPSEGPVLFLGFAGGLYPSLTAGSLCAASQYQTLAGEPIPANPELLARARQTSAVRSLPLHVAPFLTVDQIISTPQEKARLFHETRAASVNMEDFYLAQQAAAAGRPYLSIRAVLDPADQALPPYVLGLAGRPLTAAGRALLKPWRIPTLLGVARMRRYAQKSLALFGIAFLIQTLASLEEQPSSG